MNKKIETFDDLRKYLKHVPDIEHGGCGIAAYFMYQWLVKHGETPEICFLYDTRGWFSDDQEYHDSNDAALKGTGTPTACGHVALLWKGEYWDADGHYKDLTIREFTFNKELTQKVSVDFMLKALDAKGAWNEQFDRAKYLPKIEKATGITYGNVVKMVTKKVKKNLVAA